ncbi:MAG: putative poly(glycerol-phosphate) alpha-glucosyltransferase [bacterium ADurb.Bin400]|nr:MAG: putative poly(glycerol-phosphate) alpha-glucosyltransferase [bacterium ADurb.Bin400]
MKVLWLSWKDLKNPLAGGAEIVKEELARRLAKDGHEVVILTAGFAGAKQEESRDGYKIIRVGGRWTVYWHAYKYYKQHLRGWADVVIEEINTVPFFSPCYVNEKRVLFFHQLCREIWFYQMFFPLSWVGYCIEPVYLWWLRNNQVITVSDSTKKDLIKYGFSEKRINIISEGIELEPIDGLDKAKKSEEVVVLSLGAVREMKRTVHQIKAFELAKRELPNLKLKIAGSGDGRYFEKVMRLIEDSPYRQDIEYLGWVSKVEKIKLMREARLIVVTSIKEGWGLIVTEANSQGTPAVVYNVDGLRDSVKNKKTGLVTDKNSAQGLAEAIIGLLSMPMSDYEKMRKHAWEWSKKITFDESYEELRRVIGVD